ncbi:MAG: sugar transferase [Pirellulales bacterium]
MSVDMKASQPFSKTAVPTGPSAQAMPTAPRKLQLDVTMESPAYFTSKALATRILGVLLLMPAAPIIMLLLAIVRCTSRGSGLFGQTRVGRWGQEFTMYKIRTMYLDAEKSTGPVWCQPADSRITCCGRVMRFLHLDELPQLINIVRGEMDLIGPRPERPQFVDKLVNEIPDYADRLTVLPGVTGLAQINLPPDMTTDCVRRKLVLDLEYIQTANWSLDIRILLCTALRMIGIRHGHAVSLLGLVHNAPSESNNPVQVATENSCQADSNKSENGQVLELPEGGHVVNGCPSTHKQTFHVTESQYQISAASIAGVHHINCSEPVLPRKPK